MGGKEREVCELERGEVGEGVQVLLHKLLYKLAYLPAPHTQKHDLYLLS